jgi:glycosyltransferase involved in cell wall biosynthesis
MSARAAHVVYRPVSRLVFSACSRIVCASAAEGEALKDRFPKLRVPVVLVPHGVDTAAFVDAEPFSAGSLVVLAAGRMEPYKHFDRVALAADAMPLGIEVVLLGEGPAREALERLVNERNLRGRVRVLGGVSNGDVRRWFRTAKVLVSMSSRESFGLTIVEALASGVPVVASDIAAHRELADGQPTGAVRLVPIDAGPNEIADAVASAIHDGLPHGVHVASWDDTTQRILTIYEEVIAELGLPPARVARTVR